MQKKTYLQTQRQTYLQESLRNGRLIRWSDSLMPLKFYIAPFRFYSKQGEDYKYRELVIRALKTWEAASGGKVSFNIVTSLMGSQINLDWKRVDRQALGYCSFSMDNQNRVFSAEVQIGISDGIIHHEYMAEDEVYHTILHEIGHSLGLGHSPFESDIMYTPHKYGVVSLSARDKTSLKWMYKLPTNATPSEIGSKNGVQSLDIDEIIYRLIEKNDPSEFEKVKNSIQLEHRDLLKEQENIADLKKYNLALQSVKISENIRKAFIKPNYGD